MSSWLERIIARLSAPAAPTTPARSLDAAFRPSTTAPVFCSYTIQFATAHGNDGTVKLLSDAANPPTTERTQMRSALTDDTATMTNCQQLTYIVPAGHYVKLVSAGTGTPTITQQVETPLA